MQPQNKITMQLKSEQISPTSLVPEGLQYFPNFLSQDQSQIVLDELKNSDRWIGVTPSQKSRRVIQYGYKYPYTGGKLEKIDPIPAIFDQMIFNPKSKIVDFEPDQLIINEYLPGQGINPHTDHTQLFGDKVACVTIGSGCEIEFTHPSLPKYKIYVEPNSLYIMSGQSRYQWKHAICPRKNDQVKDQSTIRGQRISLTYRTVKNPSK